MIARAIIWSRNGEGELQAKLQYPELLPALMQFPARVREIAHDPEYLYPLTQLGRLFVANQQQDPKVREAIHDDIRCLIATRFLVETRPDHPLTREAVAAFPDYKPDTLTFQAVVHEFKISKPTGQEDLPWNIILSQRRPWPVLDDADYDQEEEEMPF